MSEISIWLENQGKHAVADVQPKLKIGETPQFLLHWKTGLITILEAKDKDEYYCVRSGEKFGISERMVDQMMKFCYEQGTENGIRQGEFKGYETAMKEVADKLGFGY